MTTSRNFRFMMALLLWTSVILPTALTAHADVINLEVLNPIASMKVERVVPEPRLLDLNNKRILLYWNRKLHADVAIDQVKKQLQKRFSGLELKIVKGSPWGPEEGFYEDIVAWMPDAVIGTTAD